MNRAVRLFILPVLLALFIYPGCSAPGGNALAPYEKETPGSGCHSGSAMNSRLLWGFYEIAINKATLEASVNPLRSAEFNANVTRFMQPPASPVNRITVHVDIPSSDIASGLIAADITISHPFPGMSKFSGFDVRGIFMSNGSVASGHYGGLSYSSGDEGHLLNPDGWTRWWNPSEFTSTGTIFGYTKGAFSSSGFTATSTLNPYKYFCDGLFSLDEMAVDPSSRGFFSDSSANARRYLIQFPTSSGSPVFKFNYAIDASWNPPTGGPVFGVDDFSLSANCQEAYQVSISDAGSTAWYTNSTQNGGELNLDIIVYDWQSTTNPNGVPGEVSAIWVESKQMLDSPVDVLPGATVWPDSPTSSVFRVEIKGVTPDGLSGQTILIGVESKSPSDYAPNLDGVSGFAFPDAPLAAYFFWNAPIINETPFKIPAPANLDNCAKAGIVELTWDPVDWPTLAGYNIYRKLSSDPSYDFGSPLNGALITDTYFEDKSVQTNGATYDYVVMAVDADLSESPISNETAAAPEYIKPVGFTDLESPDDGTAGDQDTLNTSDVAVDPDGNIYVVWDHNVAWPQFGIRFCRGKMSDGTFGPTVEVGEGDNPEVAFDSRGNAHIAWGLGSGDGANPKEYYYAMVDPSGVVSNLTNLHTYTYGNWWSVQPTITVTPNDEIHIAFAGYLDGYGLLYMHGTPGNFSAPEKIATDITNYLAMIDPDLDVDHDGNVHVIWIGSDFHTLFYKKRDASGTWGPDQVVVKIESGQLYRPGLAVDRQGVAHVSYNQYGFVELNHPYYINNRTGVFENPVQLETDAITNGAVQVACDPDGNAYVEWYTDLDPSDAFNWQTFVAILDLHNNVVEKTMVSEKSGYQGVMPAIAGSTDTCYADEASVATVWSTRPELPPQFARIRTDH